MLYDIAFMGGGVRGIAFCGAVAQLEKTGYLPRKLAGVSAGAIAAACFASGFTATELKKELLELDYSRFKKRDYVALGLISRFKNLRRDFGVYSADEFEKWLTILLLKKGVRTFADIKGGATGKCLQLTAADIQGKRLLVLPDDLKLFGIDANKFSVAKAVRMSMSIPLFYEPYILQAKNGKQYKIVDGGIFCNYPIWLLDDGCAKLDVPVFGAKLISDALPSDKDINIAKKFKLADYIKTVFASTLDATGHGYSRVVTGDSQRTINISVAVDGKNIISTDFDINKKSASALFNNGEHATKAFLRTWNFDRWKKMRS